MSVPLECDVLIIGAGGAGLRAAIAAAEASPKLNIALISKVYPMRSHTVSAEGGAAAVIKSNDSLDHHAYDTISGGDWMSDQDAVEAFVNEAPKEMIRLEHWGCPWSRQDDGKIAVRPFGGMKNERTWFAADKTGFHMLHALFQTSLKYDKVRRLDEWFVISLLSENGRCHGALAIELSTGKLHTIRARAVIICTGGAGRVFPFTTNAAIKTGDGMAIAYREGVPLKDMEFVQYHPTGLPFTGILITEATRAEGGHLLNKDGYRYLQDYDLGKPQPKPVLRSMELGPRDRLSQAFVGELEKGRTLQGEYGHYVHLDIRHLGAHIINSKLPFVRELCLKYENIDPIREMIPVRPVVHYMMGGIHTDITGATPMKGLYAAGEAACVSINGANRLGSNSLTELLVFGARAGKNAVEFVATDSGNKSGADAAAARGERDFVDKFINRKGGSERLADLRKEMHKCMEEGAGIYRNEASLRKSQETIVKLRERFRQVPISDKSKVFNTELTTVIEFSFLLDIAEAVIQSALLRNESRGSHQRTDFPKRDDNKFLAHSLATRKEGDLPSITYQPVKITRWPPGERVYGR